LKLLLPGNDWALARTDIVSSESFQIVFEGVRGDDFRGDVAIDDILITEGLCNQPGQWLLCFMFCCLENSVDFLRAMY